MLKKASQFRQRRKSVGSKVSWA